MERNEIKNAEDLKKLTERYFTTLNPTNDKTDHYTLPIKMRNYYELGCTISEIIKLCIVALEQEAHQTSTTIKYSPINVALILELVLEMFPLDEMEFLSCIGEVVGQE